MFRMMNKLKNRKGFTLIELIVVLAVLAIIMAIAVPRFLGVQKEAKLNADYATGASIAKAAELYYAKVSPAGSTVSAQTLITNDYMDSFKFQSDGLSSTSASAVTITFAGTGSVTVVADPPTGSDVQLYPDERP